MSPKQYAINEIFYSLQGEGIRTGTANIFVQFAGCNLACDLDPGPRSPGGFRCDTDFVSFTKMTAIQIRDACRALSVDCDWIILTGGEPALQIDFSLHATLKAAGYKLAIETNGSYDLSELALDWICVSPKMAEHTLRQRTADEVKYVRTVGQGIPRPTITANHYLLSPAFDDQGIVPGALAHCIYLCKDHPQWRLSLQTHKWTQIR